MKTSRKSRKDVEALADYEPYIPQSNWEYDQVDGALKPLDALATEMETRWGIDRLQELVSPETSAKFEAAKQKLNADILAHNVAGVIERASILMRGWKALEKEAMDRGHKPALPDIWIASVQADNGKEAVNYAIAKDNSAASLSQTDFPVYTLEEVARIIRDFNWGLMKHVDEVKKHFPAAKVIDIREPVKEDELPF